MPRFDARGFTAKQQQEAAQQAADLAAEQAAAEQSAEEARQQWLEFFELNGLVTKDGKDGTNGLDGVNGKDGLNGRDGRDGRDGVSVLSSTIVYDGEHLLSRAIGVTDRMSDGSTRVRTVKRDGLGRPIGLE